MAAVPSADTSGGAAAAAAPARVTAAIRSRAARTAPTSAGFSAAPSVRVTTRISGARSPPGNWRARAATFAESDAAGTDNGAWPAAALPPMSTMKAIPSATTANPGSQERRPVTAAATASHIVNRGISLT